MKHLQPDTNDLAMAASSSASTDVIQLLLRAVDANKIPAVNTILKTTNYSQQQWDEALSQPDSQGNTPLKVSQPMNWPG